MSGRPGATSCTQDALSFTLSKRFHGFTEKGKKKRERESILPNFHCSKIAEIYPSLGLQKSRLLFCKHPVFYSGGVGLKAGEAAGSLGHLGEAEGRPERSPKPHALWERSCEGRAGAQGRPALGPLTSPCSPSQKAGQPEEGNLRSP